MKFKNNWDFSTQRLRDIRMMCILRKGTNLVQNEKMLQILTEFEAKN